jgi:hypothetical protein
MSYTEAQFNKLPKWAQREINAANNREAVASRRQQEYVALIESAKKDMAETVLNGESAFDWRGPIVAVRQPYDEQVPVARERDHIRFYLDPNDHHDWVDISLRGGGLEITTERMMSIHPRSGNSLVVNNVAR